MPRKKILTNINSRDVRKKLLKWSPYSSIRQARREGGMIGLPRDDVYEALRMMWNEEIREQRRKAKENRRYLHTIHFDMFKKEGRLKPNAMDIPAGQPIYNEWLENLGPGTFRFQSRSKYSVNRPFNFLDEDLMDYWRLHKRNNLPDVPADQENVGRYFRAPKRLLEDCLNEVGGSAGRLVVVRRITTTQMPYTDPRLENMELFKLTINAKNVAFRGFTDKGEGRCVPELLYHHLKRNNYNKKLTLEKVIYQLDVNKQTDGKGGYTCKDIKRLLDEYKCPFKLLDIRERLFMENISTDVNTNLNVFVGQVFDNHLYYCDDKAYVKSLAESCKSSKLGNTGFYERKKKEFTGEVFPVKSLKDRFIRQFKKDKTIRDVGLYNDNIVMINYDGKKIYANEDVDAVRELTTAMEIPFENQNLTSIATSIFGDIYPNHKQSAFTTADHKFIRKHAGKVHKYRNIRLGKPMVKCDINKSRTYALRNNKLGPYARFTIFDDWENYDGSNKFGWYYCITDDFSLMNGNRVYGSGFLKYCDTQNIKYTRKYQKIALEQLDEDYGVPLVDKVMEYQPTKFKKTINTMIGYFGKTMSKYSTGHLEPDFDQATAFYWKHDNIGTMYDLKDHMDISNRQRVKVDKAKIIDVGTLEIDEDTKMFMVQETTAKQEYTNDLPIYQQVCENEWVNLYELRKKMGGRLISVKTDCVIVEGGKCPPISTDEMNLGGYKEEEISYYGEDVGDYEYPKQENTPEIEVDLGLVWNYVEVNVDDHEDMFKKLIPKLEALNQGCCITGLAGTGKSEFMKQLACYELDTTMRLAFTNKACEGLDGRTLCNTFGIDFRTGKCSNKKVSGLGSAEIDTIMTDECFQTPGFCMAILDQIKQHFPKIKHYQIGDPEQLRPVGEEKHNWLNSAIFHRLVDGNIIRLIHNNRNDCDKEYARLLKGDKLNEFRKPVKKSCKVHICKTNKMRRAINDLLMKGRLHIKWDAKIHNPKGQDVRLSKGTPVMSVVNDKELGLVNSKMFKITALNKENICIDDIIMTHEEFMKKCVVAYAFTNHKVQSITIREPYHIHEWDRMNNRERYTAFSRTGHRNLVSV